MQNALILRIYIDFACQLPETSMHVDQNVETIDAGFRELTCKVNVYMHNECILHFLLSEQKCENGVEQKVLVTNQEMQNALIVRVYIHFAY
jgi:hypothetical protein